jgi:hypothetical protein
VVTGPEQHGYGSSMGYEPSLPAGPEPPTEATPEATAT